MTDLKPANENPWYVLMTLYGEQTGEEVDWELHEKNRKAWNAWAGQALNEEERVAAAKTSGIEVQELTAWAKLEQEIHDRFGAEMRRRNKARFIVPSVPEPTKRIDLSKTAFSHTAVWEKAVFSAQAVFDSATFSADAVFRSATFSAAAVFNSTTFSADARFLSATFSADAWFNSATFSADARFNSTTFSADARFLSATFSADAVFRSATFSADAWFDSVMFSADAWFDSATFSADAWFGSATFSADAWFLSATFNADAWFLYATFSANALFDSAVFEGFVYFSEAQFGAAEASEPSKVVFRDCQFAKPTSFRDAMFQDAFPDFAGAVLHEKTTFTAKPENWPQAIEQTAEDARASCAVIRHNVGIQGLPEDEHFFFRREMHFAGKTGSIFQRLPYQAFGLVSDYGHSIARPIRALISTVVAPAGVFAAALEEPGETLNLADCLSGLALSFSNTFRIFGFQGLHFPDFYKEAGLVLDGIAGLQTILGLVFLFFLGLGLRQRFRLR